MHHFRKGSQTARKENSFNKNPRIKVFLLYNLRKQSTYADGEQNIGKADPEKRQGNTFRPHKRRADINKLFAGYRGTRNRSADNRAKLDRKQHGGAAFSLRK